MESLEKVWVGNFLHPVGDKDNLWKCHFLGIIRIGMDQLVRLAEGWEVF